MNIRIYKEELFEFYYRSQQHIHVDMVFYKYKRFTKRKYRNRCANLSSNIQPNFQRIVGLVSLFNGISTFVGYLMPKLFS